MIYDWYKVINLTEFLALDIPSRNLTLNLQDLGPKEILVTYGVGLGLTYGDVFIPVNMNGYNPYEVNDQATYFDENDTNSYYATYIDEETQDVYIGLNGREEEE